MVNTTYNSSKVMIVKLQQLKGKAKLNFYENIGDYDDEMENKTFKIEEDPLPENAQSVSKTFHEILLLMKVLQTKPQVKNTNIIYYDLYYTIIKNGAEKEIVDDKYEKSMKNDFFLILMIS